MIHLAGPAITVSSHRRQRCSWCGTIIEDVDLSRIGIPLCDRQRHGFKRRPLGRCERQAGHQGPCGQRQPGDFELPGWAFEALVEIEGTNPRCTSVVEPELHLDGTANIPAGSCMSLPPEITGEEQP